MKRKCYTNEFLVDELHRFVGENGKNPTAKDMNIKNGYPPVSVYQTHFSSFNNALETANLPLNQYQNHWQDGTETCSYCGKRADEISGFRQWLYHDGVRYCEKHGTNGICNYVTGNLDINSSTGRGRTGEILVAKVLNINKDKDCNRISCGYKFDLYNEEYGRIDVKTSLFNYNYINWTFTFEAKKEAHTYICIGFSSDRKNVEHVWVVPNEGEIKNKIGITIRDTPRALSNRKRWEINAKPYNKMWQSMKLDSCKIMVDKSKPKVVRTWEETLKALAELNKKYGVKSSI